LTIQRANLFIHGAEVQVVVGNDSILQQHGGVGVNVDSQTIRDSGMNSSMAVDMEPHTLMKTMAMKTCLQLRKELGSDVVQGLGEEVYANAIQNPFSLFNSLIRPACVVAPRISMHVQKAMSAVFRAKIRYGVQSGGHTAMTGWNTYVILFYFAKYPIPPGIPKENVTILPLLIVFSFRN